MANPDDLIFDEPMEIVQPIGQARFANVLRVAGKPLNTLPKGEDPAGWMIDPIRNVYINCDGKTPEELAKDDPGTLKEIANKATAERDRAVNDANINKRRAAIAEKEIEELRKQLISANTTTPIFTPQVPDVPKVQEVSLVPDVPKVPEIQPQVVVPKTPIFTPPSAGFVETIE